MFSVIPLLVYRYRYTGASLQVQVYRSIPRYRYRCTGTYNRYTGTGIDRYSYTGKQL